MGNLSRLYRLKVAARVANLKWVVPLAAKIHRWGVNLLLVGRSMIASFYSSNDTLPGDYVSEQLNLQNRIREILSAYKQDSAVFKYFHGQPYQGLGIANIFGDRICDYRFDDYGLRRYIKSEDHVLDIGCNCGFMAILASYRIGCRADGFDINPYMIRIGEACAEHLRIQDLVSLSCARIQEFAPVAPYDVVMSFATHWTDDLNYRVSIEEHLGRMASYLKPGGLLLFETHCNDVGNPEFYRALNSITHLFAIEGSPRITDSGTRELYVMKRH